jgi:hypothetical protein
MTTAGAGIIVQVFRLNSLFDPDRTNAGHQPRGFDQLAALYNRYRVFGVSYRIVVATAGTDILAVGVCPRNGTASPSALGDTVEQPFGNFAPLSAYQRANLTGYIDLAKVNGKTRSAYADDDTTGAEVSTNPTEAIDLNIIVESLTASAGTTMRAIFELEFDVEFSDANSLGQS